VGHDLGGGLFNRGFAGDDDIGIAASGPDVEFGHGAHGFNELFVNRFNGAATLEDVAHLAAGEADWVGGVDVDLGFK